MIHSATQAAKFKRFVRRVREVLVGVPIDPETICVGILERLWHTTISSAIRGDIGKFDDEEIAEAIGWHGNAQQIIAMLVETGWLDPCEERRLLVHDWGDHAPRHVKANVKKIGGFFMPVVAQGVALCAPESKKDAQGGALRMPEHQKPTENHAKERTPNPTQHNQTKHNPTVSTGFRAREQDLGIISFASDDLLPTALEIFRKLRYRGQQGKNLWKFAGLLRAGVISENELWDSCQEAADKGKDAPAYAFTCLRNRLRERSEPLELSELVKCVTVTPVCPASIPEGSVL